MLTCLLCWKYLQSSRRTALCVISTMLGVSTLIVVNAVIDGFQHDLRGRLHRLHADIVIQTRSPDGVPDSDRIVETIRHDPDIGSRVTAFSATLETHGIIHFQCHGQSVVQPVRMVGIDLTESSSVGSYADYLVNSANRASPSFDLDVEGERRYTANRVSSSAPTNLGEVIPATAPIDSNGPPARVILGFSIAHLRVRSHDNEQPFRNIRILAPGDCVNLATAQGSKAEPVSQVFVVSDYFRSELSEFDGGVVLVPLKELQRMQRLPNRINVIQVKLTASAESDRVVERLRQICPEPTFEVATWEERQGPLLAAVRIEQRLLNVLLLLILLVADFMILAIFSMIVSEKTRDIGILKSLGVSSATIARIFLGYGLLVGLTGTMLGVGLGILVAKNLDGIERFLAGWTGRDVFPRDVFYFECIPCSLQPGSMAWVIGGTVIVAILASLLPAVRAARLPTVDALRAN